LRGLNFASFKTDVVSIWALTTDLRYQPRRAGPERDGAAFEALKASIAAEGIRDPLKVMPAGDKYVILGGHNRYRAAKELGLAEVPVRVFAGLTTPQAATLCLVDNLNRKDLSPIDLAHHFTGMVSELGISQAELAAMTSMSEASVSTYLSLAELPEEIQARVAGGHLAVCKAGALAAMVRAKAPAPLVLRVARKAERPGVSEDDVRGIGRLLRPAQGAIDGVPFMHLPGVLQSALLDRADVRAAHAEAYLNPATFLVMHGREIGAAASIPDELMAAFAERLCTTRAEKLGTVAAWLAAALTRAGQPKNSAAEFSSSIRNMATTARRLTERRVGGGSLQAVDTAAALCDLRFLSAWVGEQLAVLNSPAGARAPAAGNSKGVSA